MCTCVVRMQRSKDRNIHGEGNGTQFHGSQEVLQYAVFVRLYEGANAVDGTVASGELSVLFARPREPVSRS